MKPGQVLFLSENDIRSLLTPKEVLELNEEVMAQYSRGNVVNPIKLHLPLYPEKGVYINSMPAYNKEDDVAGIKVVSVNYDNPRDFNLPTTLGTMILNDTNTGMPYAITGGTVVTELRTGASAGTMAKHLARKNSKVLTAVGAGTQGTQAVNMICMACPNIEEVRICDLSEASRKRCISIISELHPNVKLTEYADAQESFRGADIIMLATSSRTPILEGKEIDKGCTVVCVSEKLTKSGIQCFDKWVVDFAACTIERYNANLKRSGLTDFLSVDMVSAEIGDVITGKNPARLNDEETIIASSIGMGMQDIKTAQRAVDKALEQNIGQVLDMF